MERPGKFLGNIVFSDNKIQSFAPNSVFLREEKNSKFTKKFRVKIGPNVDVCKKTLSSRTYSVINKVRNYR